MKKTPLITLILGIILMCQLAFALQPQQSYSQIYLNPFYRETMTNNVNYTYTLSVNPPDGISEVKSAIIKYDVYLTPTVTFYLWVNGRTCNNPSYLVHTTYMDSSIGTIAFDCSNIINQEGNYQITLRPSGANTGASNAWLDLTYMNNPQGDMSIMGTEYEAGDRGTVFLQITDSQGFPENNAGCFVDIYYPEMINSSHPIFINNAPLLYKDGSEGLYYYDLTLPNITGIYMLSASCSYSFGASFVYALAGDSFSPERTTISGTFTGDSVFLNGFEDGIYTACASGGGKICQAYYDYNLSVHFTDEQLTNITSIQLFYTGEANYPAIQTFSWYNWSNGAWITLPNNLTFSGSSTTGSPIGINDFQSNQVPIESVNATTKIVRIRTYASYGRGFTLYSNWLNMRILTLTGNIHELKGNSELHVTTHFYTTITNITTTIEQARQNITSTILQAEQEILLDNNLTRMKIQELDDYVHEMNNNITISFNEVKNELDSIYSAQNQTIQDIINTNNTINSRLNEIEGKVISINQTMIEQFNITNQKIDYLSNNINVTIQGLQNNITTQLNQITEYLIIINQTTTETKNLAQQIWDYITSWLNNTINNIEYKIDLLLAQGSGVPTTIMATTDACITGSDWIITAIVEDSENNVLDNNTAACNITTSLWGLSAMNFQPEGYFEYRNTCPEPSAWNYSINCEAII